MYNMITQAINLPSARRSKRPQRSIPTEPVEMPGHTMESLDVQFGSIGFMDNTEVCKLIISSFSYLT